MTDITWQEIAAEVRAQSGIALDPRSPRSVGGGSINAAWRARAGSDHVFVKLNHAARAAMFSAEARGLELLRDAHAVRVPQPLAWGAAGGRAFLVLEWLELRAGGPQPARRLGRQLALQHRRTSDLFGLDHDNTIGSTAQPNDRTADWIEFLRDRRLGFQLELAARHGFGDRLIRRGQQLLERLPEFFGDYRPVPSLLHGDLWGGNWAAMPDGVPVVFDPAVYYGDRESDLAMTELFGGFPADFHAAYAEAWPLDPGYRERRELYQLYHVLNHANLFGTGYASQAEAMIDRLLAAAG